ncbi:NACHT, LRR and PYD domains-containing protein 12-like protein [Lates japonicus]|uniref:NACHT, LRR and PYD domains-containing protein 12-like protein n=1 Tax=Lates japonicus TaxID=270547 RepID=A0AAD3MDD8_LATJO|nr:NACHT, LRR and PYD domains-containing protein 12-like protein [Lates japonicus]
MRQRREFNDVLGILRERKVEHSLLFPAKLRINHKDQTFTTPAWSCQRYDRDQRRKEAVQDRMTEPELAV